MHEIIENPLNDVHAHQSAGVGASGSGSTQYPVYQAGFSSGYPSSSKTVLALAGIASALLVIVVALIASIINQKTGLGLPSANRNLDPISKSKPDRHSDGSKAPSPPLATEDVYFKGIDLPVTNKLCNKKGTFCIYGLATLVGKESGEASYSYSEFTSGQHVNINGTITVSSIERDGESRTFTFAFRDDQENTTPGWAAAGYFNLDQDKDPSKPGILTRFKTTESFGPKTPVGLENTSYLFPG